MIEKMRVYIHLFSRWFDATFPAEPDEHENVDLVSGVWRVDE